MAEKVYDAKGNVVHSGASKSAQDIAYANSEAGKRQAAKPQANSAAGVYADLGAVARANAAKKKAAEKKAGGEAQANALDAAYKKQ